MPVTFRILPHYNLVYVRYTGVMLVDDSLAAFRAYSRHPQAVAGQRHLVDMSQITDMERDYVRLMQLQAYKGEYLVAQEHETLMVYFAKSEMSLKVAALAKNAWCEHHGVIPIIQQDERAALDTLGLPVASIEDLLAQTTT